MRLCFICILQDVHVGILIKSKFHGIWNPRFGLSCMLSKYRPTTPIYPLIDTYYYVTKLTLKLHLTYVCNYQLQSINPVYVKMGGGRGGEENHYVQHLRVYPLPRLKWYLNSTLCTTHYDSGIVLFFIIMRRNERANEKEIWWRESRAGLEGNVKNPRITQSGKRRRY